MMIAIREFVKTGGGAMDSDQLMFMLRKQMHAEPLHQRPGWLREVELLLDAYGTKPQLEAAARIRDALKQLTAELRNGT